MVGASLASTYHGYETKQDPTPKRVASLFSRHWKQLGASKNGAVSRIAAPAACRMRSATLLNALPRDAFTPASPEWQSGVLALGR